MIAMDEMRPSSYLSSTNGKFINFGLKERCPPGTVVIRRTRKEDLIRAKNYLPHLYPQDETVDAKDQHAVVIVDSGGDSYAGAEALMDVFHVSNVSINQATGGQIILIKGEKGPKEFQNTIQFGWHIFYQKTRDYLTHLSTYWTSDGYQQTGCYNMLCPGYVQLSNFLTPGMVIPVGRSVIKLRVFKDPNTGNWMLVAEDNDHEILGYWPKEIFNNLEDISQVQIGGIAYSPKGEPSPPMGSGIFPGDPGACEFKQIGLVRGSGDYLPPGGLIRLYADIPNFYNVMELKNVGGKDGYTLQFGGPGGYTY